MREQTGRGQTQSFCAFTGDPETEIGKKWIDIIASASNGSKLAKEDLRLRGEGGVSDKAQSGLPQSQVGDVVDDYNTSITAQEEARTLVKADPDLGRLESRFLLEVLEYEKDLNNN